MNIEIANRLVEQRKKHNLSQEALAEKLGISRQAVSKWERAEASPDTDNLIRLAKIYHVSLDELLQINEEDAGGEDVYDGGSDSDFREEDAPGGGCGSDFREEDVPGGGCTAGAWEDIPGGGCASGSWEDAPCREAFCPGGGTESAAGDAVYEKPDTPSIPAWLSCMEGLPLEVTIVGIYLIIGCYWNLWHPGWLLFLLIPVLGSLPPAIRKRKPEHFAYPVLAVLVYLILGLFFGWWHPGWLIFLTVPLYYFLLGHIRRLIEEQDKDLGL